MQEIVDVHEDDGGRDTYTEGQEWRWYGEKEMEVAGKLSRWVTNENPNHSLVVGGIVMGPYSQ